jgi:hypothetical protein
VSNYYVLECPAGTGPLQFKFEVEDSARKCWYMGRLFSPDDSDDDFQPPPTPIAVRTKIDSKAAERVYPELAWNPIPLMTRRLVAAMQTAGVNNLQTYETRLVNPQGSPPPPADHYLAVNIVGLIKGADLAESETNPAVADKLLSMDFQSLAIDPIKVRDALLFRLAENISAVLAHARVRQSAESAGVSTLTWYRPEEWAG